MTVSKPCSVLIVLAATLAGAAMDMTAAFGAAKKKYPAPAAATPPVPSLSVAHETLLTPGYSIKPSDVSLPSDASLGKYRRLIQPFRNWTLICDEDLVKKHKVCNISQTIVDASGAMAFSWSLGATQQGQPFMILRAPLAVGAQGTIKLAFDDGQPPIEARMSGCDPRVCIAYLPVGPRLRGLIGKGAAPEVSYPSATPQGGTGRTALLAPLDGLADALASI